MVSQVNNIDQRIRHEQIRLSFRQLPFAVFLPPFSAFLLGFLLWDHADTVIISAWVIAVFVGCTVLGGLLLWMILTGRLTEDPDVRIKLLLIYSIITGSVWGLGGYMLFLPESLGYTALVIVWMFMPAASATMVTMSYKPLFHSITLTMLLPILLRFVIEGGALYMTMAATTVMFIGCLKYFHNHIHNMLMEAMTLRYEKSDLLEEVTLRKEIAERANIAKSRFLAAASHDLRQPLHAQTLFVAELKHRAKDPELKQIVTHLESSVESMRELFNSLLDISRLDAATIKPNIQSFSISALLGSIDIEFDKQAHQKHLKFRVVQCDEMVTSDRVLLGRILQNFVANAIRYTESGAILVCCRKRGERLRIEVRDSGRGIDSDKHDEIFEEFVQMHNPERDRDKGLGLGLAIVIRLGQLLGHKVDVRSEPGKGSVFSVSVPLYENLLAEQSGREQTGVIDKDLSGVQVLVIDNEESIRTGMYGLLREWGCIVATATGFDNAIRVLSEEMLVPQVIISDYRLPGGETGIDTLDRLLEHVSDKTLGVLITGDTAPSVLQEASTSGYQVLHKPVLLDKLRAVISSTV